MPYSHKRSPKKKRERYSKYCSFEQRKAEADTIRGIIKDNCRRDLVTGEIAYETKNLPKIQTALSTGQFSIEKTVNVDGFYEKHIRHRAEKVWFNIDKAEAKKLVERLEEGEVLNRFASKFAAMIAAVHPDAEPDKLESDLSNNL